MPKMDGLELLRRLRATSELPVIFLTSKDDERDEELGLGLGADDYIAKPFSLRLSVARIRAILRRSAPVQLFDGNGEPEISDPPSLERGRLRLDPARPKVTWDEKPVSLTDRQSVGVGKRGSVGVNLGG